MFSIVMPLYNKAHTVTRTIASVLDQEFSEFELNVVDDGSNDGSAEIVAAIGDPRITVISQRNAGPGAARTRGLEASRAEWVAFIDADDIWFSDHLTELDRVRCAAPDAGLIGAGYIECDLAGSIPDIERQAGCIERINYFRRVADGENPFWTSSAAVRKSAVLRSGAFLPLRYGEDRELWARLALDYPVYASTRETAVYVRGTGGLIDQATHRWLGAKLNSAADIAPAVATVARRYPEVREKEVQQDLEDFIDTYIGYCLTASVMIGDVKTIRCLPALYRGSPPMAHRRLLWIARLPAFAARFVYRYGRQLSRLLRRFRGA